MADRKISGLTALTAPASGDYLPIVDISEAAAASKNKRITIQSLFQGIPVNVGIGTTAPTTLLDVNADTVRVRTARTPASATATGATGEIRWDANYIYVAVGTNTWKRAALSTW